jgi:hypothetical protein
MSPRSADDCAAPPAADDSAACGAAAPQLYAARAGSAADTLPLHACEHDTQPLVPWPPAQAHGEAAAAATAQLRGASASQRAQIDSAGVHAPLRLALWRMLGECGALLGDALRPEAWCGGSRAMRAERRALRIALALAVFNQISASTSLINYAPELLQRTGVADSASAMLLSAPVSACKAVGILLGALQKLLAPSGFPAPPALLPSHAPGPTWYPFAIHRGVFRPVHACGAGVALVDKVGRRPLLVVGSFGCAACLLALAAAVAVASVAGTLLAMCCYILIFATCWAGTFWVICSEVFSMRVKSAAMALATMALFLSGAASDFAFPLLVSGLGGSAFVVFALLATAGGFYVLRAVPETNGLSLQEVQKQLQLA